MPDAFPEPDAASIAAAAESDRTTGPLHADTLTTLDGVYTTEQSTAGKQVYDMECSLCHGPSEFAGRLFQITWTGQPLSALYRHISLAMPLDNPGGLGNDEYVAVLAYILELNGYPAGEQALPETVESLDSIQMAQPPEPDSSQGSADERSPRPNTLVPEPGAPHPNEESHR